MRVERVSRKNRLDELKNLPTKKVPGVGAPLTSQNPRRRCCPAPTSSGRLHSINSMVQGPAKIPHLTLWKKSPALDTVWEAVQEKWNHTNQGQNDENNEIITLTEFVHVKTTHELMCLISAVTWEHRFAVLLLEKYDAPRIMLFHNESMVQLHDEIRLLPPLELQCLPDQQGPAGETLVPISVSCAGVETVEIAVQSHEVRTNWMYLLGESVSPSRRRNSSICLSSWSSSPRLGLEEPLRVLQRRVADTYRMGKVLESGFDYIVVEGLHLHTSTSHALKLINKGSEADLRTGARSQGDTWSKSDWVGWNEMWRILGEVYEGPQHVCLVMEWGTHNFDSQHRLGSIVLEALRLLHELLPIGDMCLDGALMVSASDIKKLIKRLLALDWHLQANLFL